MKSIGIYPGTFDPITNGHIDVIKRSLKIVDKLIIGVSNDYNKDYLFSILAEYEYSILNFTHRTEADGQSAIYLCKKNG